MVRSAIQKCYSLESHEAPWHCFLPNYPRFPLFGVEVSPEVQKSDPNVHAKVDSYKS